MSNYVAYDVKLFTSESVYGFFTEKQVLNP